MPVQLRRSLSILSVGVAHVSSLAYHIYIFYMWLDAIFLILPVHIRIFHINFAFEMRTIRRDIESIIFKIGSIRWGSTMQIYAFASSQNIIFETVIALGLDFYGAVMCYRTIGISFTESK